MKKKLVNVRLEENLLQVPEDKGKTRPLLTLFDTGCGSVLFCEGVSQKEFCPSKSHQL